MKKDYQIVSSDNSPVITLKLSEDILKDLVKSSNDNGTAVDFEIALRLARSLERDCIMKKNDDILATKAFEFIHQINNNHN